MLTLHWAFSKCWKTFCYLHIYSLSKALHCFSSMVLVFSFFKVIYSNFAQNEINQMFFIQSKSAWNQLYYTGPFHTILYCFQLNLIYFLFWFVAVYFDVYSLFYFAVYVIHFFAFHAVRIFQWYKMFRIFHFSV